MGAVAIATLPGTAAATAQDSVRHPASAAAKVRRAVFSAPRSLGVECLMVDQPGAVARVTCQSIRARPLYRQKAALGAGGHASFCREHGANNHCRIGRLERRRAQALGFGRRVSLGRFLCQVQRAGVRCTVRSTGRGFLINRNRLVATGGGHRGAGGLQHLQQFLSPDRKVWCETVEETAAEEEEQERETFCGTGIAVSGTGTFHEVFPQGLAELKPGGVVTICFIADGQAQATGGAQVCLQNWNDKAPVLDYGQRSEAGGVLCSSAANGITCIETGGLGRGKGFRVSATEVVRVRGRL